MSSKYAFSKGLREVRFLFCQTSEHSTAVRYVCHLASAHLLMRKSLMQPPPLARTFLNRAYPTMKKNNPQIPILIREASGTVPKVYARYELGVEKSQPLDGLTDKQIEDAVTGLVKNGA
ncbi:hypothetical protein S40285_06546 [Stachybotrys chlorohalonatus IBT 40285]|uniref:Ribosomal protein/NADH dehydrogenase domain-containing protein n=1 Tax=Stachybotrys chlorohalonatus (strain IBT 40285) TaxID=1283841 RepID=A0A084QEC9_STAC4|nr:hypothetical protein S40285_06546 [Stachybotrys chlorohalonata IBT 40285]